MAETYRTVNGGFQQDIKICGIKDNSLLEHWIYLQYVNITGYKNLITEK